MLIAPSNRFHGDGKSEIGTSNPAFTQDAPNAYEQIQGRSGSVHVYQAMRGDKNDSKGTGKPENTNVDNMYVEIIPDNQPSLYVNQAVEEGKNGTQSSGKTVYTNVDIIDDKYVEIIPDSQPNMYVNLKSEHEPSSDYKDIERISATKAGTANDAEYFVLEKQTARIE